MHGSTSASQNFQALTSQPAHGTRKGLVSKYWGLQTLYQGGRPWHQVGWSSKNAPKCVAGE